MNKRKMLQKILLGAKNVKFNDLVALIEAMGFVNDRVNGSHYIFKHPKVGELVNIQNVRGDAKPYQVRQVVELIESYNLALDDTEEGQAGEEGGYA